MVWYNTAAGIKAKFEDVGKFDDLKQQLEETGIIYEGDFGNLITSGFVETAGKALRELFLNSNAQYGYIGLGVEIPGEGWMYYLFDANKLDFYEAKDKAIAHFSNILN